MTTPTCACGHDQDQHRNVQTQMSGFVFFTHAYDCQEAGCPCPQFRRNN